MMSMLLAPMVYQLNPIHNGAYRVDHWMICEQLLLCLGHCSRNILVDNQDLVERPAKIVTHGDALLIKSLYSIYNFSLSCLSSHNALYASSGRYI